MYGQYVHNRVNSQTISFRGAYKTSFPLYNRPSQKFLSQYTAVTLNEDQSNSNGT